jgi:diguanylate cyclase (GGDEF)-like protein/PAS domain S-box-containing protein
MMEKYLPAVPRTMSARKLQRKVSFLSSLVAMFSSAWSWLKDFFSFRPAHAAPSAADQTAACAQLTIRYYKEQMDKARERLAFLESIFSSTSDAVIVADCDGIIQMFNAGAAELFEIDVQAAIGDNLFRLCTDHARVGAQDLARILISEQRVRNQRTVFVGQNGKVTPALITINFVSDDAGGPMAIVAVIKDNGEVERLTYTDPLTGLHNRRYFDHKIKEEFERLKRGQTGQLSLLFLDVDFFGEFNKNFGHQVGDEVLRQVGDALKGAIRCTDISARYGGEEFVAILAATDENGSLILAERVRTRIAAIQVPLPGGEPVGVTASIGAATMRSDEEITAEELIRRANEAMLQAKRSGRNQTCLASSPKICLQIKG